MTVVPMVTDPVDKKMQDAVCDIASIVTTANIKGIFGHDGPYMPYFFQRKNLTKFVMLIDVRSMEYCQIEDEGRTVGPRTKLNLSDIECKKIQSTINAAGRLVGVGERNLV